MSTHNFVVIIKPDALNRRLVGEIINRFESRGFSIIAARQFVLSKDIVEEHYREHAKSSYFNTLVEFSISGPSVVMVVNGNIRVARNVVGASTLPWECAPGTIRGDFSNNVPENLVHCSKSSEDAEREVALWEKLC
jgi:nucleoside-diphosphate kinase